MRREHFGNLNCRSYSCLPKNRRKKMILEVPDDSFDPAGPSDDPNSRLIATVQFRDMFMHLEAITVEYNEKEKKQEVQDLFNERTFNGMESIANGCDGPFHTTTINGREYTLVMTPYCR
jgi:hypothetical protein